ncbi:MAG: CoB--CoM heterodisulfide reductase iron-sulfur subunit A family protein [Ignavibacteriales bacterium]|nr:CoB--CoM heterodisulfide reductase iron-sulfur subunit A family protein [Ignavibacteriales bacterium]
MSEKKLTAVFFCDTRNGQTDTVDIPAIAEYVKKIPDVAVIWDSKTFPTSYINKIVRKIKSGNIKRIVIAGDMPGLVKNTFTKAMYLCGNNPKDVILASFKEYGAVTKADTECAKAITACSVLGIPFELAAVPDENPGHPETLVIGGGIAGIQASLEIADSGNKVYLVERTGTIGGHMAMFDKTFPTLDCAACILTPKMVEVGQHQNIELMTYCEVKNISGEPGNYKVKILKKARFVNLATCIGCGICVEKCPTLVPSEFDSKTTMRKAVYIPFPQAVPNKYLIDAENCRYVKEKKCGVCVKACPVNLCINLEEKDEEVEITVGNIIVATGFKIFDAAKMEQYGYGKFPNVVTSLEFERLVNASGPTEGKIKLKTQNKKGNWLFTKEGKEPQSIALIHCIGSRDIHYNKYCSRVCCMYSLKLAHLVKEKLPESQVYEFFIDMRAFGKGYEEFYKRIEHEGVHIIRGRTAQIEEKDGQLLLRSEDMLNDDILEQKIDMAILAVGLEPREDADAISKMLGISRTEDGWFMEANSNSDTVTTSKGGISIAGVCQGPKDIPDAVAQASAAAARVIQSIITGKVKKSIKNLQLENIESKAKQLSNVI